MGKLSSIRSDVTREKNGVSVRYPGTDIVCVVARLGNPAYEDEARQMRRAARARIAVKGGELTERESKDELAGPVSRHILLSMKNAQEDDGSPMPDTPERRETLLRDPSYHDFYDWVLEQSRNVELFRADQLEGTKGNSSPASNGS